MQNFIGLYELLTVRSEMHPFPPEHFAIGYVHNGNLPLGNIALQLMSFQTIAGRYDGLFW